MDPDDAVAQAEALLRQRREEHLAQVEKIDAALAALAGSVPTNLNRYPFQSDGGTGAITNKSVRMMLLDLLNESDRDWSVNEILAEYMKRGTPIHGKDPSNALRAAIADANKAHTIVRTDVGRYAAAQYRKREVS